MAQGPYLPDTESPDDAQDDIEQVTSWWHDGQRYYREHHDLGAECADYYYKHKRYKDDGGTTVELSPRRIKPKGNEINNLGRHKTATVAGPATYEECIPSDKQTDPLAAEFCTRILKHIFHSPRRRYKLRRRNAVSQGFTTGVGYLRAEWYEPSQGLRFAVVPHDRIFVCPGFQDMHDEACPYVIEEADLEIADIQSRAGWNDTADLWPDHCGKFSNQDEFNRATASPAPDQSFGPPTVKVLICRERRCPITEFRIVQSRVLGDDERYMRCAACNYSTMDGTRDASGMLPMDGEPCPDCLNKRGPDGMPAPTVNYLQRVDREVLREEVPKYPDGRIRIVAPLQGRLFVDDNWDEKARSFNYLQWRPYEHPHEHIGQNDVALHATKQAMLDSLTRMAWEQMRTSKRIFIVAGTGQDGMGLMDAHNRPFRLSDEAGHFAYVKGMNVEGHIKEFQGQGMPSQLPTLYNMVRGSMQETLGFTDFGLTTDRSKDIAAASLEKIEQVGEIPVQDHRDVLNDEESVFKGVCLDIWISRASPELANRALGPGRPPTPPRMPNPTMGDPGDPGDPGEPSGAQVLMLLKQTDTRDMDVTITASPSLRQMNEQQMSVIAQWISFYRQDPEAALIVAEFSNVPPSIVRRVQAKPLSPLPQQAVPPNGGPGPSPPFSTASAPSGAQPALAMR